ncbi:MAG: HXXEE domain-containing protein [Oscillospiraceae bacterium]|nr:HXXEE domain-containing protein [Oscillospiraceae bacterium]
MKESLLQKWCDQAWLYCIYLLGIMMGCVLLIRWGAWDVPQILICFLAIMIPLHVFEENTAPGGFFYMNNLEQKSAAPMVYPQNRLTNMVTNLGAEILVIILTVFATRMEAAVVVLVILFGIGELAHHTSAGIHMQKRYQGKGKTTIYGPGTITSYVCLLPLSVYGCYWMSGHAFTVTDILLGIGILLFIMICLILIPFAISRRVKSEKYAFKSAGYFAKYE